MGAMSEHSNVIAAFSEEQTEKLTGVSRYQLRYWDRTGFYVPSYAEKNRRMSFSRIYSYKDIVALRILNVLKNQYAVSLQQLRKVSEELARYGNDPERWTAANLYVLNKRVIWHEPGTRLPQVVASKQYVLPTLSLERVVADTRRDVQNARLERGKSEIGRISRKQYVNHNQAVIAGTRIPVKAIKRFLDAGYTAEQIISEYPELTLKDIKVAAVHKEKKSAA